MFRVVSSLVMAALLASTGVRAAKADQVSVNFLSDDKLKYDEEKDLGKHTIRGTFFNTGVPTFASLTIRGVRSKAVPVSGDTANDVIQVEKKDPNDPGSASKVDFFCDVMPVPVKIPPANSKCYFAVSFFVLDANEKPDNEDIGKWKLFVYVDYTIDGEDKTNSGFRRIDVVDDMAVPEPASWVMMLSVLAGMKIVRARRKPQ